MILSSRGHYKSSDGWQLMIWSNLGHYKSSKGWKLNLNVYSVYKNSHHNTTSPLRGGRLQHSPLLIC